MIRVKLTGPEATAIVDAVMRRQRQRGRVFRRDADLRAIAAAMSACTEDELLDGVEDSLRADILHGVRGH